MDGQGSIRFDRFELQPSARRLLRAGEPVRLGARAFDLLALLVAERERTLGRDELLERVWPGVVVEPNNLDVQVWALRRAIGTEAIATIPGRGYRFTLPVQAPPPAASARPVTHGASPAVAAPLARLIGRDADLAELAAVLADRRFVTVTGAGGIGKTLLVRHLLQRLAVEERRDTCWVELASLSDDADVVPAVAAALGVPLGAADPQQALAAAVAPLQLAVALDNADAVPAGTVSAVQALRARAPGVQVVVVSQVPLRMAGEQVLHLDGLALPAPDEEPEAVLRAPAVELLVERVRQRQRGFVPGQVEAAAAAAICRQLDGSALAIELAAARVPLLGLAGVAAALAEGKAVLDLPGAARRDAPPRQRSLRAALQWSHDLLGPVEQRVFRRLAVFAGGTSLPLAEAVLCGPDLERWTLLQALDDLAARSLLQVSGDEAPRYRLLEAPFALARERLAAAPEADALHECHARVLAARLASALDEVLAGRRSEDAFVRDTEPELDNARAALAWALKHDAALAVALARPLGTALTSRRLGETTRVYDATEPLLPQAAGDAVRLHWLLGAAAMLSLRQPARALQLAQQGCDLARARGDARSLARALCLVASSRDPSAAPLQDDALAKALALEREDWPAVLRQHLAAAESIRAYHRGEMACCRDATQRQLLLADAAGATVHADAARTNLADLELAAGRPEEAVRLGRALVARWLGTRNARALASARLNLAHALLAIDDTAAARAVAVDAWPGAATWMLQPYWGLALALLAALEGRSRAAAVLLGYADQVFRQRSERPEPNEARTPARAEGRVLGSLGAEAVARLVRHGELLNDEQAGRLGLAADDADAAGV